MNEDDRNFIERAESITGNLYGEPMSPDRIAENFALYGSSKRVAALERFDAELRSDIDSSPHNLRRRVQLVDLSAGRALGMAELAVLEKAAALSAIVADAFVMRNVGSF